MEWKQTKIFFSIVLIELIAVFFIGTGLLHNYQEASMFSVTPIAKDTLVFNKQSGLEYFYESKPNSNSIGGSIPATLTFNSDGLNERFEYTVEKPSNVFRIITLGDSFTYGLAVDTRYNWTEILEDLLNEHSVCPEWENIEIINLGMHGYDIRYAVERFKIRGQKYNPDLIIWQIFSGDFEIIKDVEEEYMQLYLETHENISVPDILGLSKKIQKNYGLENIVRYQTNALYSLNTLHHKAIVVFALEDFMYKPYKNILEGFATERNNIYILEPDILLEEEERFEDYHPNKKGYAVMAKALYQYLIDSDVLSCR